MNISQFCESALLELSNYHNTNNDLLYKYINERLATSLNIYYQELDKSLNYLSNRNEEKLMRKIIKDDKNNK